MTSTTLSRTHASLIGHLVAGASPLIHRQIALTVFVLSELTGRQLATQARLADQTFDWSAHHQQRDATVKKLLQARDLDAVLNALIAKAAEKFGLSDLTQIRERYRQLKQQQMARMQRY